MAESLTEPYRDMLIPLGESEPSEAEWLEATGIIDFIMDAVEQQMSRNKASNVSFSLQVNVGAGFSFSFGDLEAVPQQY